MKINTVGYKGPERRNNSGNGVRFCFHCARVYDQETEKWLAYAENNQRWRDITKEKRTDISQGLYCPGHVGAERLVNASPEAERIATTREACDMARAKEELE